MTAHVETGEPLPDDGPLDLFLADVLITDISVRKQAQEYILDVAPRAPDGSDAMEIWLGGIYALDLIAGDTFVTRVKALADLKLVVNDPPGPTALGNEATYEILVVNRGTKAAHHVQVGQRLQVRLYVHSHIADHSR